MSDSAAGVPHAGFDIPGFEIGQLFQDLAGRQAHCQQVQDIRDTNAHAALVVACAAQLRGSGGDSLGISPSPLDCQYHLTEGRTRQES